MAKNHSDLRRSAVVIALGALAAFTLGFPPHSVQLGVSYLLFVMLAVLQALPSVSVSSMLRIMGLLFAGYGVFILATGYVGVWPALAWILVGGIIVVVSHRYYAT